jgi:hypothetical protein
MDAIVLCIERAPAPREALARATRNPEDTCPEYSASLPAGALTGTAALAALVPQPFRTAAGATRIQVAIDGPALIVPQIADLKKGGAGSFSSMTATASRPGRTAWGITVDPKGDYSVNFAGAVDATVPFSVFIGGEVVGSGFIENGKLKIWEMAPIPIAKVKEDEDADGFTLSFSKTKT